VTAVSVLEPQHLLDAALAAADAAAWLLHGARPQEIRSKSTPRDLVTEWDLRSEQRIREVLVARAPTIPIWGEEGGADAQARSDTERWLVDPIDGTVNFAHGLPLWSVSVALEEHGAITVGVVVAPALGLRFWARLGQGAWVQAAGAVPEPLAVSSVETLDSALLVTGFPYDRATARDNNFAEWEHFQRRAGACRRLGSAALDLCLVARGWFDGYWERRLQPWDIAAGSLLVSEAGGRVTATDGGRFVASAGEVVASNGLLHDSVLAELAAVKATMSR
jgi:myo-inositol-1(or 4)-monophosphatase